MFETERCIAQSAQPLRELAIINVQVTNKLYVFVSNKFLPAQSQQYN